MRTQKEQEPACADFQALVPLRSPLHMPLRSFPLAVVVCGLLFLAWKFLTPTTPTFDMPLLHGCALVLPMLVAHEGLHYIVLPRKSAKMRKGFCFRPEIGVWASIYYCGDVPRNHHVLACITPFLALSVAPLLLAMLFSIDSKSLAFISLWNAMMSINDLFDATGYLLALDKQGILRSDERGILVSHLNRRVARFFFHVPDDAQSTAEPGAAK